MKTRTKKTQLPLDPAIAVARKIASGELGRRITNMHTYGKWHLGVEEPGEVSIHETERTVLAEDVKAIIDVLDLKHRQDYECEGERLSSWWTTIDGVRVSLYTLTALVGPERDGLIPINHGPMPDMTTSLDARGGQGKTGANTEHLEGGTS